MLYIYIFVCVCVCVCVCVRIYPTIYIYIPSLPRAGYIIKSVLKQSIAGLNSELSFSEIGYLFKKEGLRNVVSNFLDDNFDLQSHDYLQFRTNTLVKGMNPLIPPAVS